MNTSAMSSTIERQPKSLWHTIVPAAMWPDLQDDLPRSCQWLCVFTTDARGCPFEAVVIATARPSGRGGTMITPAEAGRIARLFLFARRRSECEASRQWARLLDEAAASA